MDQQKTISREGEISGVGLHFGQKVMCKFLPAKPNSGIVFVCTDKENKPEIPALVDFVVDTNRGTSICKNGAEVHTIEHVMAAIASLGIDNLIIEIVGNEIPILDGSAKPFYDLLESLGIQTLDAEKDYYIIDENICYTDKKRQAEITAIPFDGFKASVSIDFNSQVLVAQSASLNSIEHFKDEICKARTFVFLHELEYLVQNKLIKGGDLSNAIVFVEKPPSEQDLKKLSKILNKPAIKVNGSNTLNNIELHYPNEPARHKMLDMIGDLALLGRPVKGQIIADKPGHAVNIAFVKKLRQRLKEQQQGKVMPPINLNKPPVMNINQIMDLLPHRYPFLLVDSILELSKTHVVGVKNVTMNEPFFQGHFPNNPIMPGVMQIEAMAQVGGILAMTTFDNPNDYTPYFIKIESVKFKQKVIPGNTIVFSLRLLHPIRRGICQMAGSAFVNGKVVIEGEMMAQIIKNAD